MKEPIIRLVSVTLKNIKNVKNGTIVMPNKNKGFSFNSKAEILGIYGQNGSGKTAVVDALFFLQYFIIGHELDKTLLDYIDTDSNTAEISAQFNIFYDEELIEAGYHVCVSRDVESVIVSREYLDYSIWNAGQKTNRTIFIDYRRDATDEIFRPKNRRDEVIGKDKNIELELMVAKKMAEKSNCSFIFGENSRLIFERVDSGKFCLFSFIIRSIHLYAIRDLFVIKSTHSGVISAKSFLPMAFRLDRELDGLKGDFVIDLMNPTVIKAENKQILDCIVEQINTVLYTIIPGMRIDIKSYGKQLLDTGEEGIKVELLSMREGKKSIPIRMESEGIIKIISILNALITAYGNPSICLVVDELDAGIFEYMLGELLDIFAKGGKGQLVFTSHNLRALEMLNKDSIMFSTVNPERRYIKMRNIKKTNNFRDFYIRTINLGGQTEKLYKETDSLKIARALKKAGRRGVFE